jgi:hypothetical protein
MIKAENNKFLPAFVIKIFEWQTNGANLLSKCFTVAKWPVKLFTLTSNLLAFTVNIVLKCKVRSIHEWPITEDVV